MPVLSTRGAKSHPKLNCALGVSSRSGKYSAAGLTLPNRERIARRQGGLAWRGSAPAPQMRIASSWGPRACSAGVKTAVCRLNMPACVLSR